MFWYPRTRSLWNITLKQVPQGTELKKIRGEYLGALSLCVSLGFSLFGRYRTKQKATFVLTQDMLLGWLLALSCNAGPVTEEHSETIN